jgi:putative protein-disulfide isomerase
MAPVELLYFANPMCSWCWGFDPVLRGIEAAYADRVRITVALGALGDRDRPMRERDKAFVREHWERVRRSPASRSTSASSTAPASSTTPARPAAP